MIPLLCCFSVASHIDSILCTLNPTSPIISYYKPSKDHYQIIQQQKPGAFRAGLPFSNNCTDCAVSGFPCKSIKPPYTFPVPSILSDTCDIKFLHHPLSTLHHHLLYGLPILTPEAVGIPDPGDLV